MPIQPNKVLEIIQKIKKTVISKDAIDNYSLNRRPTRDEKKKKKENQTKFRSELKNMYI